MSDLAATRVDVAPRPGPIAVSVNGSSRDVPAETTVTALLAILGLVGGKVAVERNEAIVPRSRHTATVLKPGDRLEIVHFIGGG